MPFESLSYERPLQRVPEDVHQVKFYLFGNSLEASVAPSFNQDLDSAYSRKTSQQLPTRLYIIISGGERKERYYFSNLGRIVPVGCAIPLYFVCPIGRKSGKDTSSHLGSSPKDLLEYWKTSYRASTNTLSLLGRTYQLNENDRVYFVSDVDVFYPDLQSFLKAQTHPCVHWAISNPCIEVWLYYSCIGKPSLDDYNLLEGESTPYRAKKLKQICAQYKGGIDPRKAPEFLERAIANANSFGYKEDKHGIPILFCSSMLRFAEEFVQYMSAFKG